ncbi:MAG: hypothetical protein Greene041679_33 [Parcubacteria group bacterium Greene0416_79]|nr:MAG: hypothetical protein Greene041679_33 [Parcubacteria group bacterium Greene0416_79]
MAVIFAFALNAQEPLASAQALPPEGVWPVYYQGAIYPTGYPYPKTPSSYIGPGGYGTYGSSLAPALSVSCTATPLSARVGETVLWYSSVTGGAGSYQYFWSGADGLSGNTSSVRRAYDTPGEKFGTVTVTSGSQSVTAGCVQALRIGSALATAPLSPAPAVPPAANRFGISCFATQDTIATGEGVAWFATVSGASPTATTTYTWAGTDGLSGDGPATFKTYATEGRKHALLTVTSGGERAVAACTNAVAVAPRVVAAAPSKITTVKTPTAALAELQGICSASVSEAVIGDSVSWQAVAAGGEGAYLYAWSGSDGLTGEEARISKQYETEGKKAATVIITAGSKEVTAACPEVRVKRKRDSGLFAASVLSGFTNPLCLILGALLAVALGAILALLKKRKEENADNQTGKPSL